MTENKAKLSEEILALRKEGYTFAEIAKELDVSLSMVYIKARELRKEYGEEAVKIPHTKRHLNKIREVESLAKDGLSLKEIAQKCKLSENTLYKWLHQNSEFKYSKIKVKDRPTAKIADNATYNQKRIIEEYNKNTNATVRDIAVKVNLSHQAVYNALTKAGVDLTRKYYLAQ